MKKFLAVILACFTVIAATAAVPEKVTPTKNVIVMITDGTSTGLLSLSRWYKYSKTRSLAEMSLNIDPYVTALVSPMHTNAPIVGSAGAMTTYMTGQLATAANIAVYPKEDRANDMVVIDQSMENNPLVTVLEAMKVYQDKATGLVATVEFTHATPAACAAHSVSRYSADQMKYQMASAGLDVVFSAGTSRIDARMEEILAHNGVSLYKDDIKGFRAHNEGKIWSLWGSKMMAFDLDRDPAQEPSLKEMSEKAIELLSQNKNGFFLMIEGSKVDYAAHANDPVAAITEFIAFDDAVGAVLDFAKKDGNTTVVILPDHGTAGINFGKRSYSGYHSKPVDSVFVKLGNVQATYAKMADLISKAKPTEIRRLFTANTGFELTDEEFMRIVSLMTVKEGDYMQVANTRNLQSEIARIYQDRGNVGFISGGHTGEDLFLSVYHPKNQVPTGVIWNYELNDYLCKAAGLKRSLADYTAEQFVCQDELFLGCDCVVDSSTEVPALYVKRGRSELKLEAQSNIVQVGKKTIELPLPVIYIQETEKFYAPISLKKYVK